MPLVVINGPTIAAGESLSDAVDLSAGGIVRLVTPDDWTSANITFEVSNTAGGTYRALCTVYALRAADRHRLPAGAIGDHCRDYSGELSENPFRHGGRADRAGGAARVFFRGGQVMP
jgi:hypothetical protein